MVVKPSRPSGGSARKGRGLEPPRVNQVGTRPPGRWGNADRSTAPAPQSKPVTPASRLVAQVAPLVASGLGLRILAAGPAHLRLYSRCGRLCEPGLKSLLGLVRGRGHRLIRRQRLARLPGACPPAESLTGTATPGDRIENWDIRSWPLSPIAPVLRSDDETRSIVIRMLVNARGATRRCASWRPRSARALSMLRPPQSSPAMCSAWAVGPAAASRRSPNIAPRRWALPRAERPVDWGLSDR